ncbi:MAG TPA: LysR family transcriptional regulator [Gammaproteobacteria bacterium]
MAAFARVAHHGSFTRAAADLGVSPSAISQTVRGLESKLGIRLLNRTTRNVGLSEAGRRFLERVGPALELIGEAFDDLGELRDRPTGHLRVTLPRIPAATLLAPLLGKFTRAYPDVLLELTINDELTDLVARGFDAGIRLGERLAQDMVAVRISRPQRLAVIGSPEYLRNRPAPHTPTELHAHACLRFRYPTSGAIYRWEFERDGQALEIDIDGRFITNDIDMMVAAARQGLGLAAVFEDCVRAELASGTLVRVLEDWCAPFPGFFIYYPSRVRMPSKLRVFVDFLKQSLDDD